MNSRAKTKTHQHNTSFFNKKEQEEKMKTNTMVRPFLMQSDSASRKRPFSTGLFFDWILLVLLLITSRVDFIVFALFLEAVGVREYCCMALENRLAARCFARSSRATRASRARNPRPGGLVALGLAESRQGYVRGVALSRAPPKLQQKSRCWQNGIHNARYCCRVIDAAGERS